MSSSNDNALLRNPPVVEVIIEVHWALHPLQAVPGAGIDPFYSETLAALSGALHRSGFSFVETRIPDEIPREIVAYQAAKMFRTGPDQWPVYQYGPGVFTANTVAPYDGWQKFFSFFVNGVDLLVSSHPVPSRLKPIRLSLRYLNAFREEHGVSDLTSFLRQIGVSFNPPVPIKTDIADDAQVVVAGEARFPLRGREGAVGLLSWRPISQADGKIAVGFDLNVVFAFLDQNHATQLKDCLVELNTAHDLIGKWFNSILTDEMRLHLDPEIPNDTTSPN